MIENQPDHILDSIVVSIPACHAGGRCSIPRRGSQGFLADQFWVRWKTEYLHNQKRRSNWNERCRNLTIGDIVILKDEAHRSEWPLGKVFDAIKSQDGLVRQTKITSWKDGEKKSYLRPMYYQHHYTTEIFHCRIPADRQRIVSLLTGNVSYPC